MRISDWSSDVCSSDLHDARGTIGTGDEHLFEIALGALLVLAQKRVQIAGHACRLGDTGLDAARVHAGDADRRTLHLQFLARSEERRVGKEGVSTCRSWWSTYH